MCHLCLGKHDDILVVIIPNIICFRSIFAYDSTGFLARSAKFFSDGVKVSIQTMSESGRQAITKSASLQEVASRGVGLANESNVHEVTALNNYHE